MLLQNDSVHFSICFFCKAQIFFYEYFFFFFFFLFFCKAQIMNIEPQLKFYLTTLTN